MDSIRTYMVCKYCDSIILTYDDFLEHKTNCIYCECGSKLYTITCPRIECPRIEKVDHDKLLSIYNKQYMSFFLISMILAERDYIFNIGNWILSPSWYYDYEHTIPDYRSYHAWYVHRDLKQYVNEYSIIDEYSPFAKHANYINSILDMNNTHIEDLTQLQEEGTNKINNYFNTNINFHIVVHYPVFAKYSTLHFHFYDDEMYTVDKNKRNVEKRFQISISQVVDMINDNTMRSRLKSECCIYLQGMQNN